MQAEGKRKPGVEGDALGSNACVRPWSARVRGGRHETWQNPRRGQRGRAQGQVPKRAFFCLHSWGTASSRIATPCAVDDLYLFVEADSIAHDAKRTVLSGAGACHEGALPMAFDVYHRKINDRPQVRPALHLPRVKMRTRPCHLTLYRCPDEQHRCPDEQHRHSGDG